MICFVFALESASKFVLKKCSHVQHSGVSEIRAQYFPVEILNPIQHACIMKKLYCESYKATLTEPKTEQSSKFIRGRIYARKYGLAMALSKVYRGG